MVFQHWTLTQHWHWSPTAGCWGSSPIMLLYGIHYDYKYSKMQYSFNHTDIATNRSSPPTSSCKPNSQINNLCTNSAAMICPNTVFFSQPSLVVQRDFLPEFAWRQCVLLGHTACSHGRSRKYVVLREQEVGPLRFNNIWRHGFKFTNRACWHSL